MATTEDRHRSTETDLLDISSEHQTLSDQARRTQRLGRDTGTERAQRRSWCVIGAVYLAALVVL
jgi:hypothetical protein